MRLNGRDKDETMTPLVAPASIYPEDLLDDVASGPESDAVGVRRWWAVYTKSRQEKALARQLLGYEIPFFLPLIAQDSYVRSRRVRTEVPLFGGYLFLFATEQERVRTLTTNRISRLLDVARQDDLRADLRNLWQLLRADRPLTAERRLAPGQRVRVKSGAMLGMEGTVISRQGRSRLLVAVNFLQQGASVEIDDFQLEPL